MNILIVGGSGYLGKNLILKLPKRHFITSFDKKPLDKGIFNKSSKVKIREVVGNLFSQNSNQLTLNNIDIIYYRLGILGGPESNKIKTAKRYLKINFELLARFLKMLEKNIGTKKFIFDSSEQVFGNYGLLSKNTNNSEPLPMNYYGLSKLMCEKYLLNWYKKTNVPVDIFRYPRVVDKTSNDVISQMIESCLKDKKIYIRDNPNRRISFLHLSDAVNANLKSIEKINTAYRTMNLSNNEDITIENLAKNIISKISLKTKIIYSSNFNSNNFQPMKTNMKSYETEKDLKWNAKVKLDRIINQKIIYHLKNKKNEKK